MSLLQYLPQSVTPVERRLRCYLLRVWEASLATLGCVVGRWSERFVRQFLVC